ncbi:MAG: alanine--tRNA ligase [Candidatus Hydrothermota bacterium]|nr:MAG: alanine--tRNA ligase [Candidatus Hydrothermae bacterium]
MLPKGDPTLLFTNAGMNQFKPYFLRIVEPPFTRAASCQKCMRAGGKHNDLDNVGFTRRHHTFFEMLGNFSFGDYFKKEAITWAWELLTEVYGLPKDRLWITIFREDDEAFYIWRDEVGMPEERIVRMGEKDNFWEMGDTGPCGPCSEIHYDLGPELDPNQKSVAEEGERFLELWNLVFTQYNRRPDGSLEPLPHKNIDTGMGLERILAVLQGVDSNYHTDLFMPLIEEVERITGVKYKPTIEGAPHRVLADHIRALSFSIADGIYPSNFGRGYVLRRILRRAHRFAQKLDVHEPVLYRLVGVVAEIMGDTYPEVRLKKAEIAQIIKSEEERFLKTIARNIPRLAEALERAKESGVLSGEDIFKLYDTYGLPLDLIEDYAKDAGVEMDMDGYNRYMAEQRERARKAVQFEATPWTIFDEDYQASEFVGYDTLEADAKIVKARRRSDGKWEIVLDRTPFYAESGGQIGDRGKITGLDDEFEFVVEDTQRIEGDIIHIGRIVKGEAKGQRVRAAVDKEHRLACARAHTATHLMHAALREVLGEHVRQEGSLVEPDRLRFDFAHFQAMTPDEIRRVERIVNEKITENIELTVEYMDYHRAIELGAIALFTEKYGHKVRVVSIGDFSKELCGGTHCKRTGDIGFFKIVKEEAAAAGIRRIDAYTGMKALQWVWDVEDVVRETSGVLAVEPSKLPLRARKLVDELEAERERASALLDRLAASVAKELRSKVEERNGVKVLGAVVRGMDIEGLRRVADNLIAGFDGQFVLVLGGVAKDRPSVFVRVHKDLTDKISAVQLVRQIGRMIRGGGGGTAEKAEGGGRDASKLDEAVKEAVSSLTP